MKKIFTLLFLLITSLLFSSNVYSKENKNLACPTVSISYTGTPYCSSNNSPQPVTLTGTGTFTGGIFTSFPGLDLNSVTGAITPSTSTAGTYNVSYTIPSDGTCPAIVVNAMVTILPSQSISLTSASSTINQTVCLNTAITNITYAVNNATGASVTGLPAGVTGTYATGTFTISGIPTVPGAYNYTVYTTGGACFPVATAVGTIIVPPTQIATIGSNQTICSGNSALLTFTGTPNATVSYTINGGAVQNITLNSSGNATLTTAPLTSNTVYNLVSTSASGCSNAVSGSAIITVNPPPTIFGLPSACMGNIIQFTGSGIPAASNPWTSSNMAVATVNSTGLVTTMSPGITTITYKNNIGCTAMQTLVVHNVPIITANSSLQTICSGTNTNITLTSTIPGTTYSWNVVQVGVTGASASADNPSGIINHILTASGTTAGQAVYTVTPTANGCSGSPITVTVQVNPTPTVIPNTFGETINSGETTNVTLSSNVAGTTFSWTVSQSNVTGATSGSGNNINQQLYTVDSSQNGYITYTITPYFNGCAGVSEIVQTTVNSNLSTNNFISQNFIISPNPVTDILNIKNIQTIKRVTAFNQLGQMVLQKEYNSNEVQLDFSTLKTGIYFISLDSDKKQSTFKIVKN